MKSTAKMRLRKVAAVTAATTMVIGIGMSTLFTASAVTYSKDVYEAESATRHNVTVSSNHTGYTGTGFVDGFGEVGDYVQFSISVPSEKDYLFNFRYANDCGSRNTRQVYVDGNFRSNAYFDDQANWDTWATAKVGAHLTAGSHTIKVSVDNSSDGYINLDNMMVTNQQESVRSLYISNWSNQLAIWKASHLADNDTASTGGPRIDEWRYNSNWNEDQLKDYTGFFRDETAGKKYDQPHNFNSEAYYDESGVLHTNYLEYDGSHLPNMEISKDYVMVPNQNVIVARYALKNTSISSKTYSVLDMLHPEQAGSANTHAYYDSTKKVIILDRSAGNKPSMAIGAFATPTYYQAANDGDSSTSSSTCAAWYTFDNDGTLKNNSNVTTQDASAAMVQKVTVAANQTSYVYFYVAMAGSVSDVTSTINTVRAQTGAHWFSTTATSYSNWFNGVTIPTYTDADLIATYKRNLVMIKNSIRPGTSTSDGAFTATTNMYNYGYKVWARDSAVTAMALDAAGLTQEAGTYWKWLAARQASNGTFETCYYLWNNEDANFVEPEYDSIGFFLIGVYRHYMATGDTAFLNSVWGSVKKAADFVKNNMTTTGFGPADFSIFEESDKFGYYTYTQAGYGMGLKAAALLAKVKGLDSLVDDYNGAGSTILTAINKDTTDGGLWDNTNKYYVRLVFKDGGNVCSTIDSSTNILFALGAIDPNSSRATQHVANVEASCGHDVYGLARYEGDNFYGDSPWSPGGNEALEDSPSWPQMSMWDCVYQKMVGNTTKAYNMLKWFADRTNTGFMVTGECESNVTQQPCVSTASEPITAAAYIMASLQYCDQYDSRVFASESNAGCYKGLSVNGGCSGDYAQYNNVPYYVDAKGDTASTDSNTDISKVYICNDASNIYIRINNVSGALTGYQQGKFAMSVFTEKFGASASTRTTTPNGTALNRDMAFQFKRSDSDEGYSKYKVSGGNWVKDKDITSVTIPQWDTTTGTIEMVIPRSEIGSPANDSWGHITVMLQKGSNGSFTDQDFACFNYRLTSSNEAWMYGDFE